MATLPDTPVNTAIVVGGLAAMGLVGFVTHTRAKLDARNLENHRDYKLIDAGMQPETTPLRLAKES